MSIWIEYCDAENACENGVEFKFDTKVQRLEKKDDIWEIHTNQVYSRRNMW